jgi:hypothetical protein
MNPPRDITPHKIDKSVPMLDVSVLRSIPQLSNLPADALKTVKRACCIINFSHEEVIFSPGEPTHQVFFLLSGSVLVKQPQELTAWANSTKWPSPIIPQGKNVTHRKATQWFSEPEKSTLHHSCEVPPIVLPETESHSGMRVECAVMSARVDPSPREDVQVQLYSRLFPLTARASQALLKSWKALPHLHTNILNNDVEGFAEYRVMRRSFFAETSSR